MGGSSAGHAANRWMKTYIDPVAAAYPSLPFAEWSAAMDAIERKGGMIFVPRKRGHARLGRAGDGPIVVSSANSSRKERQERKGLEGSLPSNAFASSASFAVTNSQRSDT